MSIRWIKSKYTILLGILILAGAYKIWLFTSNVIPFNSDEAVVGLMARHIQMGERPIFFYGQAYMGSLDAFLVSAGFTLFGAHVWVIRMVQTILYLGTILTTYFLGEKGLRSSTAGLTAAFLMAIPAVNTTLYTTASLGGYGEAILIGNLILLAALTLCNRYSESAQATDRNGIPRVWGVLGFLVGLGLWAFGLSLIYSLSAGITLLAVLYKNRDRVEWVKVIPICLVGFFAGSAPWWWYALQHGLNSLVLELTGSAVAVETNGLVSKAVAHGINYLLLGIPAFLGLRPPWEVRWLVLPLLPVVLVCWALILHHSIRNASPFQGPFWSMLWGVILIQAAAFLLTPFGIDPSGRYFLPLLVPFSLMAGFFVAKAPMRGVLRWTVIVIIILFQAGGTIQCALKNPPGISTQFGSETQVDHSFDQDLIQFLSETGQTSGYTNYWVAYPLAFLSAEKVVFIPDLPYHQDLRYTSRDDRYLPYQKLVRESPQAAFITTGQPALEGLLRDFFKESGIQWTEKRIGDYQIFYHLSQKPDMVGLSSKTRVP